MTHDNCPTCGAPFYKAKIARAAEWLAERFAEQKEWDSYDLYTLAKEHGISRSALFAAKDFVGAKATQKTTETSRTWSWAIST
jgi:hypothetical protein